MNNNIFDKISIDLKNNLKKIGIKKNDIVYLGINLGKTFNFYKELLFKIDKLPNIKFDIIINDVSGISSKVAKMSNWFNNVPCNSGIDGTKLTMKVLKNFNTFLKPNGRLYFPIISLSNENKIFAFMKKKKLSTNLSQ